MSGYATAIAGAIDTLADAATLGSAVYESTKPIHHYFRSNKRSSGGSLSKMSDNKKPRVERPIARVNRGPLVRPQLVKIVGNPDLMQRNGSIVFRAVKGWGYDKRKLRWCKNFFSPLIVKQGDLLTTDAADNIAPSCVVSGATTDMTTHFNRWVNTDLLAGSGITKGDATVQASLSVQGLGSDRYAEICIPVLPITSYGGIDLKPSGENSAVSTPIGGLDVFAEFKDGSTTTGGIYGYTPGMTAGGAYSFKVPSTTGGITNAAESAPSGSTEIDETYIWMHTDFYIYNNNSKTMTYELYQCQPRMVTRNSPLFDLTLVSKDIAVENNTYEVGIEGNPFSRVGRDPREFRLFNERWRVTKRVVDVVPGSHVKVSMYTPLSLLKYEILKKLLNGDSFVSAPGLTQWLWVRAYGPRGFDTETTCGGTARGQFYIQMYQKTGFLAGFPKITKKIYLQKYLNDCDPDEKLQQDDVA